MFTILHVLLGASAVGGAIALFAEAVVKNAGSMAAAEYSNAALHAAFTSADTSGDGWISVSEFERALQRIGVVLSPAELHEAYSAFDDNSDGQIEVGEFVSAIRPHLEREATLEIALKMALARRCDGRLERAARQVWSALVAQRILVLWAVWLAIGAIWGVVAQGWDVVTGIYFAVGGLSTGGLQAPPLSASGTLPAASALFVAFYCLTGVPIFGFALGRFADVFVTRLLAERERRALRRPISEDEFAFAEGLFAADEQLELSEFLALELLRLGKVDTALLDAIRREFARLDVDGDGKLTRAEVKRALRAEGGV